MREDLVRKREKLAELFQIWYRKKYVFSSFTIVTLTRVMNETNFYSHQNKQ